MSKIYVFAIGGTGSRVLRSLTMMLASGVETNGYDIVPVIIDPDSSNADLTLSISTLNEYSEIRSRLNFSQSKNRFFKTPIVSVHSLSDYKMTVANTSNKRFKEFINLAAMSRETRAMTEMLFSQKNLNAQMSVGFKGNPNIGSVVLNQIVTPEDATQRRAVSLEFEAFANSFQDGDRIFIVSSIFGGTGASGFPLLLKTLRHNKIIPNSGLINNSTIGAISVLPYFQLKTNVQSEINSDTFTSKTRAALSYYENNIDKEINALYFIADDKYNTYDNNEGGATQRDQAHLVEFFAATAILDFAKKEFPNTQYLELGVNNANIDSHKVIGSVRFTDLYSGLRGMLIRPLTMFALTANLFKHHFLEISVTSLNKNNKLFKDTEAFYHSSYVEQTKYFLNSYLQWLREMQENIRQLDLFKLDCGEKPFEIINGVVPQRVTNYRSNYSLYYYYLNEAATTSGISEENAFMELYYLGADKVMKEKFKM